MIEVKTAELIGPALDFSAAKAEGLNCKVIKLSTDWSQAGQLIDKYGISLVPPCGAHNDWDAYIYDSIGNTVGSAERCETALIAICRAVVAAQLGDTVQVPAELIQQ